MPLVGCAIPIYSADKSKRSEQLIYTSENLRALVQEWERFWFLDQPDHMTPYRVHGGVI
jgi:anti-sigma-K factor RskA